jgi:hypothetical protein
MARLLVGPGCGPIKMTWAWHPAWSAGIAEVPFVCESVYCFHLQGRSKWFAQVPLWIAPPMIILRRIKSRAAKPSQLRTRFIPHKEPCGKTQSATYSFYSSVRTNLASIPSAISSVQKEWSSTEKEWSAGKEAHWVYGGHAHIKVGWFSEEMLVVSVVTFFLGTVSVVIIVAASWLQDL